MRQLRSSATETDRRDNARENRMTEEHDSSNTANTSQSNLLETQGEHDNINSEESSDDEAIMNAGDRGRQEDNPLINEPNRNPTRTRENFGRTNSSPLDDANNVTHPSMEVLLETWRMQQQHQNTRHNHLQVRRGRNFGIQDHRHEQGRNSALVHASNSAETPSREAQFEAWPMQPQNPRHNEQPRHVPVDSLLRRADNLATQDNRLIQGQHQEPPVMDVQGVDETSRAIIGAGRKAFSYRIAKQMQERHIRQRIQSTVKSHIFRKVKFITSTEYYERVMKVIVEQEKPENKAKFVRVYKTCVVGAVNTKRSACEQAAAEVVRKLLKDTNHQDEVAPAPYSVETLCKLRQSQTPEEKEAFRWFVGELLECVVGKITWGKKKYQEKISEAVHANTTEKVVTVSDEAFGLVLYENYIDKWITKYHNPSAQGERGKKILGKYTRSSVGYTEYGGWSEEGVLRFNELCSLVEEDRSSRNARDAEEQVMLALRQHRFGEQSQNDAANRNDQQSVIDSERSLERNVEIVNAYIEL